MPLVFDKHGRQTAARLWNHGGLRRASKPEGADL